MRFFLREYQERAIEQVREHHLADPILVLPTGGGKTVVAAEIVRLAVERGRSVLFLAHRKELITQAATKLLGFGIQAGIIKAGITEARQYPVQVASVQSLVRREKPPADVVIVDEAHRATARTYSDVLSSYPDATVIGLTATPFRMDGQGLGDIFGHIVVGACPSELIKLGFIMRPRVFVGVETPDLSNVRSQAGDYAKGQLSTEMAKPKLVADIVECWQKHGDGRTTVCFASSVEHSKAIAQEFLDAGVEAEHIDGKTPEEERDAILRRLATGKTTVVCNYGILTEGWDLPEAGVCILARPTKSLGLYIQMAGRVLRTAEGKQAPIILDHGLLTERHGFVTDDLEYSLDSKTKRHGVPPMRTCPECYACVLAAIRTCPECGHTVEPQPTAPLETTAGTMKEILDAERFWYTRKLKTASNRFRKVGWARRQFHDRYSRWPQFWALEREHYRPFGMEITVESVERYTKAPIPEEPPRPGAGWGRPGPSWKHLADVAVEHHWSDRTNATDRGRDSATDPLPFRVTP